MAAACLRVPGFLSAAGSRKAGLVVPFKTPTRCFHRSHWAFRELQTKPQPGEQVYEGEEYIPREKARNPMKAVGIAWAIGFPSGIILFFLTKRQVEKNRLKQLKIHQKIKASNEGEYARERYKLATRRPEEVTETNT
ncbi:PREDICTED: probable hydrolase PNKD isoform X2 [Gekko japonicus]|uniref:Probable hydrolase PNKD isoform X2 n=1 Tax=Gekko japonicus TaxID=146911 RepID=A0ABM1JVN1_GEKJA|nr:PREDICTED: probable hydrolase PNKD isoform X2 [Gekko japonicus]